MKQLVIKYKKPIAFLIKNKKLFNKKEEINIIKNQKILRSFSGSMVSKSIIWGIFFSFLFLTTEAEIYH
jgi:hypothetical protein